MNKQHLMFNKLKTGFIALIVALLPALNVMAAGPKEPSTLQNPLALALLIVIVVLALGIILVASIVNSAIKKYRQNLDSQRRQGGPVQQVSALLGITGLLLFSAVPGFAQTAEPAAVVVDNSINGLSQTTFYILVGIIIIEIVILLALVYQLKFLMGIERAPSVAKAGATSGNPFMKWWWKINATVSADKESDIEMDHEYDGIRELNNRIPPWWNWTFAFTILFAVVYMWRYHVSHTAPLQAEEYTIAVQKAEIEKAAYLKQAAASGLIIDATTAKMMDQAGIDAGKALFTANCVACHGGAGEGNAVGPNLTDDYWIHGGTINDIFRTIHDGVPDKGMISWKSNFSPVQIQELSSFIKSLQGTNPPNAKEPQGDLFKEAAAPAAAAETPAAATDTTAAGPGT